MRTNGIFQGYVIKIEDFFRGRIKKIWNSLVEGGKLKLVNSLLIPVFFFCPSEARWKRRWFKRNLYSRQVVLPKRKIYSLCSSYHCDVDYILSSDLLYLQSLFLCGMLLQRVWPAFICVVVQKVEDAGEMNSCWKFNRTSVHLWTALVSDLSFQGYMKFFACDVPMYDICRLQTADRRPQTADCKLYLTTGHPDSQQPPRS